MTDVDSVNQDKLQTALRALTDLIADELTVGEITELAEMQLDGDYVEALVNAAPKLFAMAARWLDPMHECAWHAHYNAALPAVNEMRQRIAELERLLRELSTNPDPMMSDVGKVAELIAADRSGRRFAELERQLAAQIREANDGAVFAERCATLRGQLAEARELCDDLLGYARMEWAWKYGAMWAAKYRSAFGVDEPRHALDAPQPEKP